MKKILVIGNNPLSYSQPNAKTVLSLLDDKSRFSLSQIYFRNDVPTFPNCNYFKITDKDMLKSITFLKKAGEKICAHSQENTYNTVMKPVSGGKYFLRFAREVIWSIGHINWKNLIDWINNEDVDEIFFVGGDCIFAYKIMLRILERTSVNKLILFVTDDYILPRKTKNPFFWLRRNALISYMKKSIEKSSLFIVISEEMRNQYNTIFAKSAKVYANIPDNIFNGVEKSNAVNNRIVFVYAGGLHYNRWKILGKLSKAISDYNAKDKSIKAVLHIFSQQKLSEEEMKSLCFDDSTLFLGEVTPFEMPSVLQKADVLVHVESFEPECIEATRLSFSTKIYEYTAQSKCILAIGPSEVASMKFLSKCAYYVDNENEIQENLIERLTDCNLRELIARRCVDAFEKAISENCCKTELQNIIEAL